MKTLVKQQLNLAFNFSALKWYFRHDKKKFLGRAAIAVILIFSLLPVYYFYVQILHNLFMAGLSLWQPEFVLSTALVMVSMFVLVLGIPYVIANFYFSQDLTFLIPLPFKPGEIIGAKFFVVLVQEYLTAIPLLLPALIIYGTGTGAGPYFWLSGLVVIFLAPVIPLGIISILIMVIMRFTSLGNRKDFLRLIGMFLLVFLILVANYFLTRVSVETPEVFMEMLMANDGLIKMITKAFPPVLLATKGMAAGGLVALRYLLAFIGLNLLILALTYYAGEHLFYRGFIGGTEVTAAQSLSAEQLPEKAYRASAPAWAIARREIKILFRTPIYLFNSVGVLVILPIAMLIPFLSGELSEPLLLLTQQNEARVLVNLIGAAFIAFMAVFVPASSTSFSREGRHFWLSQVIPVPPGEQIKGKIYYSLLLTLLSVPLVILLSVLITKWSLLELIIILVVGLCAGFPVINLGLLIDLLNPYLTWENPQKAIKQNANAVWSMLAAAVVFLLLYGVVMFLYKLAVADFYIYAAVAVVALFLGFLTYSFLQKIADRRYRDIISP